MNDTLALNDRSGIGGGTATARKAMCRASERELSGICLVEKQGENDEEARCGDGGSQHSSVTDGAKKTAVLLAGGVGVALMGDVPEGMPPSKGEKQNEYDRQQGSGSQHLTGATSFGLHEYEGN